MFSWLKRQRKLSETAEEEVVYRFKAPDIDRLVDSMSTILRVRFYSHQSPMIGPWYSSHDLDSIGKAMKECGHDEAKDLAAKMEVDGIPHIEIVLNDPDQYRGGLEIPNGGDYLLRVTTNQQKVRKIDKRLSNSDLVFKKLR
jgi:hypothetical protein